MDKCFPLPFLCLLSFQGRCEASKVEPSEFQLVSFGDRCVGDTATQVRVGKQGLGWNLGWIK